MTKPTPIQPLRNEADYAAALRRFESYFDNEPAAGSPEGDRFVLLGVAIAKYEEERYSSSPASPAPPARGEWIQ